jgi:hypothetical protein
MMIVNVAGTGYRKGTNGNKNSQIIIKLNIGDIKCGVSNPSEEV